MIDNILGLFTLTSFETMRPSSVLTMARPAMLRSLSNQVCHKPPPLNNSQLMLVVMSVTTALVVDFTLYHLDMPFAAWHLGLLRRYNEDSTTRTGDILLLAFHADLKEAFVLMFGDRFDA